MLQTDVPALNDTSCGQLMPFPEDTGGGANNGSHDDLLFGRDNEMQEEASQDDRAGAASNIVVGDVWTPLVISGSSISSRENETSEAHIAEPLANHSNTRVGPWDEISRGHHRTSCTVGKRRTEIQRTHPDNAEPNASCQTKTGAAQKMRPPDNMELTYALRL